MNRLLPAAAAHEAFFHDWVRIQEERLREVEERFAPLRLLTAPLQDDEVTGLERLAELGRLIFADVEPEAVLSTARRVRFARSGSTYTVHLPLPGARPDALEVSKLEDELLVRAGAHRRALKLPRRIAGLAIRSARLDGPELVVTFEREAGAAPTPALAEH
jgi:arsenite-transporting ATPase